MTEYSEELSAQACDVGKRLDAFIAEYTEISRSAAARLIEEKRVSVGELTVPKNYRMCEGDTVSLYIPEAQPSEAVPENIPIDIVYEDEDIIVVNKEQGMVVHPAPGNYSGTLVNALLYHCGDSLSGVGGVVRPGIVHRIDKDTGGLLVVAKNDMAHLYLAEQIKEHNVTRVYYAIVRGNLREDSGIVNAPIGRHPTDRKRMAVIPDSSGRRSREAVTHWSVAQRFGQYTLLRLELETGRTHQIRVHLSHIGHPLLGDEVYGAKSAKPTALEKRCAKYIKGQCLYATELTLTHPRTKKEMRFQASLPENFESILSLLGGIEQ